MNPPPLVVCLRLCARRYDAVKDVLYEPVRKTQEATHFMTVVAPDGSQHFTPCSPVREEEEVHDVEHIGLTVFVYSVPVCVAVLGRSCSC